jgi:hypothetical protein
MNKFILLMSFAFLFSFVSGQEAITTKTSHNEFGVHSGATTGIGLSYRHWFNKIGFQLTALPVKTDDVTFISGGVTGLYSFYEGKYVGVFGYLGTHYFVTDRNEDIWDEATMTYSTHKVRESLYNFGFGPGFTFGRVVRFNLMIGYGFYDVFEKFNMYPTGEIGLYYRF